MAPKPTDFPRWATVASTDPESGQPNVTEPPDSRKDNGWQRKERAAANWMNWLFNNIYQWILWAEGEIVTLSGASGDYLEKAENLADVPNSTTARVNLGVEIGTDVQAYDAGLQSISSLTTAADAMIYTTALDTYATTTLTNFARTLLDDTDAAGMRTTLGLVIGTNVQAFDTGLLSIAALGTAADRIIYTTGVDTYAEAPITTFGRGLIDDADAATGRATLEVDSVVSADLDIPASGSPVTFPHGMGETPAFVEVTLVCISADRGYAVGDETAGYWQQRSTLDIGGGAFYTKNATNILVYPGYDNEMPYVLNRSDGPLYQLSQVEQGLEAGRWKLRIRAKRK